MRCKLCRQRAVYGELRFCKEHFIAYYEKKAHHYMDRTRFEGAKLKGSKILVGVSGGKDSTAVAAVLQRLAPEFGYELALFSINLRIPDYSEKGLSSAEKLAKTLGLPLIVWDLKDYPRQIPDFTIFHGKPVKPCSQCGTIKRYLLNKAAVEGGYEFVATGHNLDDEFFFVMHSLYQHDYHQLIRSDRWLPPRPEHKLAGRIKPLYYLSEKENVLYCMLRGLEFDNDECPFSEGNPQLLFKIRTDANRAQKANLLKMVRTLKAGKPEEPEEKAEGIKILACPSCGFSTTRDDACAYCRLMGER